MQYDDEFLDRIPIRLNVNFAGSACLRRKPPSFLNLQFGNICMPSVNFFGLMLGVLGISTTKVLL